MAGSGRARNRAHLTVSAARRADQAAIDAANKNAQSPVVNRAANRPQVDPAAAAARDQQKKQKMLATLHSELTYTDGSGHLHLIPKGQMQAIVRERFAGVVVKNIPMDKLGHATLAAELSARIRKATQRAEEGWSSC